MAMRQVAIGCLAAPLVVLVSGVVADDATTAPAPAKNNAAPPAKNAAPAASAPVGPEWACHAVDDTLRGADGVKLADINGDGLTDIATGWEEGGATRVYLHPGHAKAKEKWPAVTVGRTPAVEDAVFTMHPGNNGHPDAPGLVPAYGSAEE